MDNSVPDWAVNVTDWFELSKPGYMKRFVICAEPDDAVQLGHIAHQSGAQLQRCALGRARVPWCHYYLPDDTAQATLELIAYFTGPHELGDHMRGRLTES